MPLPIWVLMLAAVALSYLVRLSSLLNSPRQWLLTRTPAPIQGFMSGHLTCAFCSGLSCGLLIFICAAGWPHTPYPLSMTEAVWGIGRIAALAAAAGVVSLAFDILMLVGEAAESLSVWLHSGEYADTGDDIPASPEESS